MTESKFGAASSELMPGARNAVETCLAIAAGEAVALIADEPSCEVAASLEAALQHAGGGAWGGCVYDVDAIVAALRTGSP